VCTMQLEADFVAVLSDRLITRGLFLFLVSVLGQRHLPADGGEFPPLMLTQFAVLECTTLG